MRDYWIFLSAILLALAFAPKHCHQSADETTLARLRAKVEICSLAKLDVVVDRDVFGKYHARCEE